MHLKINDQFHIANIGPQDKAAYLEHLQERQIYEQTLAIPFPYTEADADWWINHCQEEYKKQGDRTTNWCIRRSSDGYLVGGIGFMSLEAGKDHRAELGYWLAKPLWNQGVMTQAVKVAADYGFRELGLSRITANVFAFNHGSAKVLEKAGFSYEGYLRQHYKKDGRFFDGKLYALLKDDHQRRTTQARPDFIKHFSEIQSADDSHYPGDEELMSIGSPFARKFGFKKLGIHHELLPPGRRTSWPHAESTEEEFVYVIEGNPDAWIDGELFRLNPGDAVGFPPGTGICHSFLNNTEQDVRLLVVGEANTKENKCIYALHPERNAEIAKDGFLWEDAPKRKMGSHDGLPDRLREKLRTSGKNQPSS